MGRSRSSSEAIVNNPLLGHINPYGWFAINPDRPSFLEAA